MQTKYPESLNLAGTRSLAYEYNSLGQLVKTTYPEKNAQGQAYTEQYVYNAAGLKTQFTDKNGRIWTYEYDEAGRVRAEFTPEHWLPRTVSKRLPPAATAYSSRFWQKVLSV